MTTTRTKIGVLAVRRSILIKASPERVWQEFDSLSRFKAWFGTGHTLLKYEPKLGGNVLFEVAHEGRTLQYGGKIIVFEPGSELTFEDDWIPNTGWLEPSLITFRLTPALDGTLVELFHHALERTGPNAADDHAGFEGGWDNHHLEALRRVIEG
jgi:uncharacterized protein YndB with AHSA1/START domain